MSLVAPTLTSAFQEIWARISRTLQEELGDSTYRSWIAPLLIDEQATTPTLLAPSRFMRDWISSHYQAHITKLWQEDMPQVLRVEIETIRVQQPLPAQEPSSLIATAAPIAALEEKKVINAAPSVAVTTSVPSADEILSFESDTFLGELDARFTFENFVVGKPNELAYAAALRVAEASEVLYNPLFLYGGVGLGKTHLMHAIAWHIRKCHPTRRVIYLSAEKFMYQFVKALRFKDTVAFKELFRSVDVLMIDDVQFISGKDSTQEEFFHTFNALVDQNRQVIISADKSPSDLEGMEERLKSRLGWGLVADIHPTSYELRLGILQAKADALGIHVPKDVIEFLSAKIVSNIRELEGALNRLIAHATLVGREISIDTTQEVLRDLIKSNDRRLTVDDIQKRVCEYYNVKLADMHSSKRSQNIARPRQVAMYLSKTLTSRSLPDIGRKFGGRDHTTVLHAVRKVEQLCKEDKEFSNDLQLISRTLESF